MVTFFKKVNFSLILIASLLLLSACLGNSGENNDTVNENAKTNNDENNNEEENIFNPESDHTDGNNNKEENVPSSEFNKSSTDIGSDFDKEVKETLSEFNVEETEDGAKLTLPEDILFDFDSYELLSEADEAIEQLVQVIEVADDNEDVTIVGHTDSKGEDSYNKKLSEDRAHAVLKALTEKGINEDRLNAEGKGADEPIAKNTNSDGSDNPDGRQKNRRVEVIIHGLNQ